MAVDNEPKTVTEGNEPTEPKQGEEGKGSEPIEPAQGGEGQAAGEGGVEDKHGHPGINREKYHRDMAAKDKEIAELRAQVAEATKTEEGCKALEERIAKLEADQMDERVTHKLEMAGCRNAKAAKALLDDYDGDVDKLKEACPYLFSETKQTGSTGLRPRGEVDGIDAKLDRAMGIKTKE